MEYALIVNKHAKATGEEKLKNECEKLLLIVHNKLEAEAKKHGATAQQLIEGLTSKDGSKK